MGYPSGTFSDPSAGRLEVHFNSRFNSSAVSGGSGDWWTGGASWNVVLKCSVTDAGGTVYKAFIDFKTPHALITLDYPGGNAAWTVAIEYYSDSQGGLGSVSSIAPTITCILIKR